MILSLRVKGLRRYADQSIELGPGVAFIEGENNAGKTTLLYAIEYALFGRVTGHKTIAALMGPKVKAMGVELVFRGKDGHRWRLQRIHVLPPRSRTSTVGHFTLKRGAAPIDAPSGDVDPQVEDYVVSSDFDDREEALALALQRALGVSRRFFDVAVYLRQGEIASILEGAPRELDIVLGVTSAVVAADEMRAMALEREKEAAQLPLIEETLRSMDRDREGGQSEIDRLDREAGERAARARELDEILGKTDADLSALRPRYAALEALEEAADACERANELLVEARLGIDEPAGDDGARLKDLEARDLALDLEQHALDRPRGDLGGRVARRMAHAHGPTCESCGQAIDTERAARQLAEWSAQLALLDTRLAELAAERAAVRAELAQVRGSARAMPGHIEEARARLKARELSAESARAALDRQRASVHALGIEGADAASLVNALAASLEAERDAIRARGTRAEAERELSQRAEQELAERRRALAARLAGAERERARLRGAVEALREQVTTAASLRVLSQSFQELQSALRERAARALALETLAIHRALQAGGSEPGELKALRLDPESYAMLVTPNDIGREVPASAAQGGGHRLLLGLALKLAIGRVVARPPFLLLDEPTYGLDRERREALLERIASLGITDQILLITHHPTGQAPGRRIRIVRRGKTSRVEVEAGA